MPPIYAAGTSDAMTDTSDTMTDISDSALDIIVAPPPPLLRPRALMEARFLFGTKLHGSSLPARAHGSYARGCLSGGEALAIEGPGWQVMRPSRNRNWGHPKLLSFIRDFAMKAREEDDWSGLLVGDLSQPRGGPMMSGHASHQIGLDVDIWLMPAPRRILTTFERETLKPLSVVKNRHEINSQRWSIAHMRLLRRAASYKEVSRIFVHPPIKRALCDWAGLEGGEHEYWLRKIRPWYGHVAHFHVRLQCVSEDRSCYNQAPPPPGSGCGSALAWWFSDEPWEKRRRQKRVMDKDTPILRSVMTLSDLPRRCKSVLDAQAKRK